MAAAWSIPVSSAVMKALIVAASGRGIPGGGIMPACSMRIAFSSDWALRSGWARSTPVHEKFPDFSLSLWQAAQVLVTKACSEATVANVSGLCAAAQREQQITALIRTNRVT